MEQKLKQRIFRERRMHGMMHVIYSDMVGTQYSFLSPCLSQDKHAMCAAFGSRRSQEPGGERLHKFMNNSEGIAL